MSNNPRWSLRKRDGVITTQIEQGVPLEHFPFAVDEPRPPFAFGACAFLVTSNGDLVAAETKAQEAVAALNGYNDYKTVVRELVAALQIAAGYVHDRAAGGRMIRTVEEAKNDAPIIIAALASAAQLTTDDNNRKEQQL